MYTAFQQPTRRSQSGPFLSFVKPSYRKGYEIPGLPYQTNGYRSMTCWSTREQILRIIPGYDRATGQVYRQNINVNEFSPDDGYDHYLSDTFMTASVVSNFGARNQTFITSYDPKSEDAMRYHGDTVINMFVKNVANSVLNADKGKRTKFQVTDEMRQWCAKDGPIKYPKMALLMQALVFKRNGADTKDDNGNPLVDENGNTLPLLTVVGVDGRQSLMELMKGLVEPMDPGKPLDASTNNRLGGMGEADGRILFLNPSQDPTTGVRMLKPSVQGPTKGWTPTPWPLSEEEIKSWWIPWDDLLQYLTAQEQCQFLAQEFGADSVNYFIGTDPIFNGLELPGEIKNAGLGRYARFVSGSSATSFSAPSRPAASPSPATRSFGMPKQAAAGFAPQGFAPKAPAAPANPAEAALSAGFTAAPKPKSTFAGLRANAAIDKDKLAAALNGIHKAQQPTTGQASLAQDLLNDNDLEDYMDPNLPEDSEAF